MTIEEFTHDDQFIIIETAKKDRGRSGVALDKQGRITHLIMSSPQTVEEARQDDDDIYQTPKKVDYIMELAQFSLSKEAQDSVKGFLTKWVHSSNSAPPSPPENMDLEAFVHDHVRAAVEDTEAQLDNPHSELHRTLDPTIREEIRNFVSGENSKERFLDEGMNRMTRRMHTHVRQKAGENLLGALFDRAGSREEPNVMEQMPESVIKALFEYQKKVKTQGTKGVREK